MARPKAPAPALLAVDKADADAYLETHPNLDPDSVVVVTPRSTTAVRGANISRVYVTRDMVAHPDRVKLNRLALSGILPGSGAEPAPDSGETE